MAALVAAALRTRGRAAHTDRQAPRPLLVFAVSFAAATLLAFAPSTWAGFALSVAVLAVAGMLLVRCSREAGWNLTHVVAIAAGAVLSRALLAFTYYPVIGDVSAASKYAHNVVMLVLVGLVMWLAFLRSRAFGPPRSGCRFAVRVPDNGWAAGPSRA